MRRGKLEIMIDILKVVQRTEATKTSIVYKANLNFNRADNYLEALIDQGLITKASNHYLITNLGAGYLQKMSDVREVLETPTC
ncbi:winged helix-turn-helix domain-containing protein [Methanohalophilus sp.]